MRKALIPFLALVLCSACGTEVKRLGDEKKKTPQPACPAAPVDSHEIELSTVQPLPAKFALELDGVLKVNDCQAVAPVAPRVGARKLGANALLIRVEHHRAYPALPASTALRVLDLGNCGGSPRVAVSTIRVPLTFVPTYFSGPQCAATNSARARVEYAVDPLATP